MGGGRTEGEGAGKLKKGDPGETSNLQKAKTMDCRIEEELDQGKEKRIAISPTCGGVLNMEIRMRAVQTPR